MPFSWSGAAGGAQGALRQQQQDALAAAQQQAEIEEMLALRHYRNQQVEAEKQRMALERERMGMDREKFAAAQDIAAADRRQAQNKAGVGSMVFQGIQQGATTPKVGRLILAQEGVIPPDEGLAPDPETAAQDRLRMAVEQARQIEDIQTGGRIREIEAGGAEDRRTIGARGAEERRTLAARPTQTAAAGGGTVTAPGGGLSPYASEAATRAKEAIARIKPKVGTFTAGALGETLDVIPGTPAANLDAELNTLSANLAFLELQMMREASRTGGALGQITERELDLLRSVRGAIAQRQSPANLREQLDLVSQSIDRWVQSSGGGPPAPAGGGVGIRSIREIK